MASDELKALRESVVQILNDQDAEVILYCGAIDESGYRLLRDATAGSTNRYAILILATFGGDPHSAFRIAKHLHRTYGHYTTLVPSFCKSAGTLICIGARELVICDDGELGPLDMQVRKPDELIEVGSGLDISQAFDSLQNKALAAFREYLIQIGAGTRMTTKICVDIATNLTVGLFAPIYSQLDGIRLGEMERAVEIAHAYGQKLGALGQNLKRDALAKLITGYPSHSFVIERAEVEELFKRVRRPNSQEERLVDTFRIFTSPDKLSGSQFVMNITRQLEANDNDKEEADDHHSESGSGEDPEAKEQRASAGDRNGRAVPGEANEGERVRGVEGKRPNGKSGKRKEAEGAAP